jgi:hypothetical protein
MATIYGYSLSTIACAVLAIGVILQVTVVLISFVE